MSHRERPNESIHFQASAALYAIKQSLSTVLGIVEVPLAHQDFGRTKRYQFLHGSQQLNFDKTM